MKAIQVQRFGGPEVMELRDVPAPSPGPGQVLVRQSAIGVNFIDVYRRTGLYQVPLPLTPGMEGAGTVEAVGADVKSPRPGDRVAYASVPGTYAELALIAADRTVTLPGRVTFEQAAAVMLQGMTAHYLVFDTCPLRKGDVVLVHAAAGGVGLLLVQTARMRGARVIATVSTAEKAALARDAGAQEIIRYTEQDFVAEVRRLTAGAGVRAVFDSVGKDTFLKSLDCLAPRGMLVSFGQSSGKVEGFEPLLLSAKGSLYVTRPLLAHYVADTESLRRRAGDVLGWVARGTLKVRIGAKFPLGDAAEAHRQLEARKTTGKVLLIP
ncbi:MAG: quinone oxidoreductase family protein [Spirochaetia bacterium]